MATPVLIPVAEYLSSTYRPDRDFVDGELVERKVGERPHGLLPGILFTIFQANRLSWGLLPLLEQRVQTNGTRFRIPDLCVVRPGEKDPIVRRSPLLCVEVLSSDDRLARAQQRALDYLTMGSNMSGSSTRSLMRPGVAINGANGSPFPALSPLKPLQSGSAFPMCSSSSEPAGVGALAALQGSLSTLGLGVGLQPLRDALRLPSAVG